MLLTIVAIIILFSLTSYFVKIKLDIGSSNIDNTKSYIDTEELPESSDKIVTLAKFKESRYAFLHFAEFALLVKRPYGMNPNLPSGNDEETFGRIDGGTDLGQSTDSSTTTPVGCSSICTNDPTCNAWELGNGSCKRYNIGEGNFKKDDTSSNRIGYIFRGKDSWAVRDLSGLPQEKLFFKNIAKMVLKLKCKVPELRSRAVNVIGNSDVKYCYDNQLSPDGASEEYLNKRDRAISNLEDSIAFFIFTGDSGNYPDKIELSLLFAKLAHELKNSENPPFKDDHRKYAIYGDGGDVQGAVDALLASWEPYILVRTWFENNFDNVGTGYITRDDLAEFYRQAIATGNTIELDGTPLEGFGLDDNQCMTEQQILDRVHNFFSKYDTNQDGKITLTELLNSDNIPKPKLELTCT